jgi:hypothetical protein
MTNTFIKKGEQYIAAGEIYFLVTPPLPPVVFWNQQVSGLEAARSLSLRELSPRSFIFNRLEYYILIDIQ